MANNNFSIEFVNASEIASVNAISSSLKKGQTANIITFGEPSKMRKGRGANRNPLAGRVMVMQEFGGFQVGTNYKRSVENAAGRSGNEAAEVKTKKSWHTYFNDFFETDVATRTKYYLQIQWSEKQGTSVNSTYFVDGRIATPAELAIIKEWTPEGEYNMSSTQVEAGVSAENERHYITLSLSKILSIKQGDSRYMVSQFKEKQAEIMAYAK
jgi:hypothetical protein